MVFHIECVDIGRDGSISGPNFDPGTIANPAWRPPDEAEKPAPGHYCYLRYAIEDNPDWASARTVVIAVAGLGASLMVIGFAVASTCAAVVTNTFFAFAIASIAGISFVVVQFSDYLSPEALWWLPAGNVGVLIAMTACWMVPIGSDVVRYRLWDRDRDREDRREEDEEEGIEAGDEAGATFQIDYDELAHAMNRVEHANKEGHDLRPRGDMAKAISSSSPPETKKEDDTNKED
jgi:hypothetical protein